MLNLRRAKSRACKHARYARYALALAIVYTRDRYYMRAAGKNGPISRNRLVATSEKGNGEDMTCFHYERSGASAEMQMIAVGHANANTNR